MIEKRKEDCEVKEKEEKEEIKENLVSKDEEIGNDEIDSRHLENIEGS